MKEGEGEERVSRLIPSKIEENRNVKSKERSERRLNEGSRGDTNSSYPASMLQNREKVSIEGNQYGIEGNGDGEGVSFVEVGRPENIDYVTIEYVGAVFIGCWHYVTSSYTINPDNRLVSHTSKC